LNIFNYIKNIIDVLLFVNKIKTQKADCTFMSVT